ncbi:MAG: arginine decarboxylase, pyruvoyl-dependent [Elusimicrobia bacterium]|nr:arginine decarboxylase, pyruvoyl-dependent [Elusimicrobiota bacterium]
MGRDVVRYISLTKGVGRHRERLASFEEALRDAKIAQYNLVHVSSIFPPHCSLLPISKGVQRLKPGQVVHCVIARCETDENHRLVVSSIGVSIPKDRSQYGYLSEHHAYGETEKKAEDYAEDLAASMLATTLGIDFNAETSWDEQREIWRISGKIVKTTNVTQSAIGAAGKWTSVVAAAVLIP